MKKLVTILFCAVAGVGLASNYYVGDVAGMTNALTIATSGDTVWLSNGTYNAVEGAGMEAYYFAVIPDGVTMRSISGNRDDVVLDGAPESVGAGYGMVRMDSDSWLRDITVVNGAAYIASYGGGGTYGGNVSNCVISNCEADQYGAGACTSVLYNCLLSGNKGYIYGGAAAFCKLYDCEITGNSTASDIPGAGIASSEAWRCTISGNSAGLSAGVIESDCYNCLIISNTATSQGGGAGWSTLYNCTLAFNQSSDGGIYTSTVVNCISFGSTNSDVDVTDSFSCGAGFSGEGSITSAPLFIAPTNGNFRLSLSSPCINTGANDAWTESSTDLDGNPRVSDGRVDMGCYESSRSFFIGSSIKAIRASSIHAIAGKP